MGITSSHEHSEKSQNLAVRMQSALISTLQPSDPFTVVMEALGILKASLEGHIEGYTSEDLENARHTFQLAYQREWDAEHPQKEERAPR